VIEETKRLIQSAKYMAVTVDEVTAVDNSSFLTVHAYIVQDWMRIPLLISLQRVECSLNDDNLTELIVGAINSGGGLDRESIATKLLSFGADGASILQGSRSGVTLQIKDKHTPFVIGVHCVAHRCNLPFKMLSSLSIFGDIEKLLSITYIYFSKSPKRYSEFKQLAELTQMKGLKMLRNVQIHWVSLREPLCHLLSKYQTLIYKMTVDLNENVKVEVSSSFLFLVSICICLVVSVCIGFEVACVCFFLLFSALCLCLRVTVSLILCVQSCLQLLLDPFTMLGMCVLLPLLKPIDTLVNFAQKRNVYICDFVAIVKVC